MTAWHGGPLPEAALHLTASCGDRGPRVCNRIPLGSSRKGTGQWNQGRPRDPASRTRGRGAVAAQVSKRGRKRQQERGREAGERGLISPSGWERRDTHWLLRDSHMLPPRRRGVLAVSPEPLPCLGSAREPGCHVTTLAGSLGHGGTWHSPRPALAFSRDLASLHTRLPVPQVPVPCLPPASKHQSPGCQAWHWQAPWRHRVGESLCAGVVRGGVSVQQSSRLPMPGILGINPAPRGPQDNLPALDGAGGGFRVGGG